MEKIGPLLAVAVLLVACKGGQTETPPPGGETEEKNTTPVAMDAGLAPPSESEVESESESSRASEGERELMIAPQEGFEVHGFDIGGRSLVWNEKGEGPVHRIYRRPIAGGEVERLGEDGRYMALIAVGDQAQVVGETLTATTRGGHWRLSPGKTQKSPMGCYAQYAGYCYGVDDETFRVVRWRKPGDKLEQVARSLELPADARHPYRMIEVDEDGTIYRLINWRDGDRKRFGRVDAIERPGAKPVEVPTPHLMFGGSTHAATGGYLYYNYETTGPGWVNEMRRVRAGAEPERLFGGRRIRGLYFADGLPLGVYKSKGTAHWTLARLDLETDAVEVVAEFRDMPWPAAVHRGYFYFVEAGSIYRLPL